LLTWLGLVIVSESMQDAVGNEGPMEIVEEEVAHAPLPLPEGQAVPVGQGLQPGAGGVSSPTPVEHNQPLLHRSQRNRDRWNYNVLKRVHDEFAREAAQRRLDNAEVGSALTAETNMMLHGITSQEPATFDEAVNGQFAREWKAAMEAEITALLESDTWKGVRDDEVPPSTAIGSKWIFKTKLNPDKSYRFKALLVIKGYEHRSGIDYDSTYAPVSWLPTLRILISLAPSRGWFVDHVDVVTAFLNPDIDRKDVYMLLPPGFPEMRPDLAYSTVVLKKALYGLKQAPRLWYKAIDSLLLSMGFSKSNAEPNLYIQPNFYLILYVDDMLMVYADPGKAKVIKHCLNSKYRMSDLGPVRRFLGLEIEQHPDGAYSISQTEYIETVLRCFQMDKANGASTPLAKDTRLSEFTDDKQVDQNSYFKRIGALMYISLGTRPDITFAVSALSSYSCDPYTVHQTAVSRVLRYLKQTKTMGLHFKSHGAVPTLTGFTDADWAGDSRNWRSIGAFVFLLGGPVSWQSKRQSIVATSTLESEYSAFLEAVKEVLWLRQVLADIQWEVSLNTAGNTISAASSHSAYPPTLSQPTTIYTDSARAIQTVSSEGVTARNKHFDICLFKSREVQQLGIVRFIFVPGEDNAADGLTKALPESMHRRFLTMIGLSATLD